MQYLKFVASRFMTFLLVVLVGVTVVFILPRLLPSDPVESMISKMQTNSTFMEADALNQMREVLRQNFGLEGSFFEQYTSFLKRAIFTQDFGVSLSKYPTPVMTLILRALPWTIGLLISTTIISFIIGNLIGLLAGCWSENPVSKILEGISVVLYPIPYYIFALALIMIFAYIIPIFPLTTTIIGDPWSWMRIKAILYNSVLPAVSLLFAGIGWWVISMKTLASEINEEDFVKFARMKGLRKRTIVKNYILPNAIPSQIVILSLRLGTVFSGALVTEVLFSYPGIGSLICDAIMQSDYNLIVGSITVSILAVAVTTFVADITYPLFDPRARLK